MLACGEEEARLWFTTKILPGTLLSYLIHQLPINYLLKFFFILSEAYNIKALMYVGELGLIKV